MSFQDLPAPCEGAPPMRQMLGWTCTRCIDAVPDRVTQELLGLNQTLSQLGLPMEPLFSLQLVLAEVLNNVVEHAYGDSGKGSICLTVSVREHRITCEVIDHGRAMPGGRLPPARRHRPDTLDIQDLPEGGFGWALIHDLTTGLDYSRSAGMNRLCFHIPLKP